MTSQKTVAKETTFVTNFPSVVWADVGKQQLRNALSSSVRRYMMNGKLTCQKCPP